jgi:hypothetical protein
LGETSLGNNEEDLFNAMGDISNSINRGNNLLVKSPDPLSIVTLYTVKNGKRELYRSFTAAWGVRVPPGRYEAVVGIVPPYRFKPFTIPPGKRVILEVDGHGKVRANFIDSLLKIEVLDKNRKAVHKGKSDVWNKVMAGKYTLRAYQTPFFEKIIPNFIVYPGGKHEVDVPGAGAAVLRYPNITGFYIYDSNDKKLGNYLTNMPVVLKSANYRFFLNKDCHFENVNIGGSDRVLDLDCSTGKAIKKKKDKEDEPGE